MGATCPCLRISPTSMARAAAKPPPSSLYSRRTKSVSHVGCGFAASSISHTSTGAPTLGKFLKTGIPLVTKRVTVEGDAIARPQNIEVPIGTLYRDVIDACGGVKEGVELGKIIFGGPMMGGAAPSADFPVLKQNNGLLLFSKKAAALPEPSACIRCGRCIEACPMGLEPVVIAQDFANKDFAALKARCVDLCVACGSCTYACPAKRPVSQTMGLAKGWYMAELRKGGK